MTKQQIRSGYIEASRLHVSYCILKQGPVWRIAAEKQSLQLGAERQFPYLVLLDVFCMGEVNYWGEVVDIWASKPRAKEVGD